ncbi:MAG TPA: tetratricopeptide repeat protein [Paracoccaceae bacterium]|nr:tetratricopeptide repeat protein [Paracoccaceae bacterium]
MAKPGIAAAWLAAAATLALSACETERPEDVTGNIIDDARIENLLLTAGDPDEAVRYFEKALAEEPDRADFRRGLAISLSRAGRYPEAARHFEELIALDQATPEDRLQYAFVAARLARWDDVETAVAGLPPGLQTTRRSLVEAMAADHAQNWEAADAAYAQAEALATNPADVLNNWGVSLMARGDLARAEEMFERALSFDSTLFNAKNNLAIARGLQGDFRVPPIPMTETEQAYILNNLGLIAMRKGENAIARGLFAAAIEAHPRYYAAAASRLEALEAVVAN